MCSFGTLPYNYGWLWGFHTWPFQTVNKGWQSLNLAMRICNVRIDKECAIGQTRAGKSSGIILRNIWHAFSLPMFDAHTQGLKGKNNSQRLYRRLIAGCGQHFYNKRGSFFLNYFRKWIAWILQVHGQKRAIGEGNQFLSVVFKIKKRLINIIVRAT